MDKLMFKILVLLKEHYNELRQGVRYQVDVMDDKSSARQFYTSTLDENLYEPMSEKTINAYSRGSGNELKDKMLALRSSSAMTYNILGNNSIIMNGILYKNEFEWQYKTLETSPMPANLDALLTSDNGEIIACEMKMLEWLLGTSSSIKKTYLHKENYFDINTAETFIPIIESMVDINKPQSLDKFYCYFKQYDVFQMIKHCLALYNACNRGDLKCKKLTLLNCVWELEKVEKLSEEVKNKYLSALKKEHDGFHIFYSKIDPIIKLFSKINIEFDIVYMNTNDFINSIIYDINHKNYLRRYTLTQD